MIVFGTIFFILLFETLIFVYYCWLISSITKRKLTIPIKIGLLLIQFIVNYQVFTIIVDGQNNYLAEKKQESIRLENEQKEIVRINSNSELLHIYRGYEDMRKLICIDYYYRENDDCKKQEEKCKNIKYMFKDSVKPEDVELLEKMKAGCSYNGWF
jgi:energy-coupling factor transporter transmembrane protein EcfT